MKSFKILIANRGEIALRIIRACKTMQIQTVAVYSVCDRACLHTRLADEAICIGDNLPQHSYLNADAIISAAKITGADGIHPGYGFLAENACFAHSVIQNGLIWFGPSPEIISQMGNKTTAIETMKSLGIPTVPGLTNPNIESENLMTQANAIGYPLLVKASAGGGGRGINKVNQPRDLIDCIKETQAFAQHCFLDQTVYLEKFLDKPRHIELQILGNTEGKVVCIGERDCSIQRRQQKIIEEAPGINLPQVQLDTLKANCISACQSMGYVGAGTLEFLFQDDQFYFIEMNTRIQVEHPISEMIYGVDIIAEQINCHLGQTTLDLCLTKPQGHAIECRINAECPVDYTPCPGKVTSLHFPSGPGVRIDTLLYSGYTVEPYYDSMVAKIIVHRSCRQSAINAMQQALRETYIGGIKTNTELHRNIFNSDWFQEGHYTIHSLDQLKKSASKPTDTVIG